MNDPTVEQLAKSRGTPAVSILCPLDTRRPGNPSDPAVLTMLRDRAAARVQARVPAGLASATMSRVDEALATIDLQHPPAGVAVFVSPDDTRIMTLDSAVEPEVVVGERFAIRGVLNALTHSPHARALVLSQARSRCFDVDGHRSIEHFDFGFPIEVEAPVEADTPHRDFPLDEHEHAEAVKFVLRAVDDSLHALQRRDERPLVLVGAERDLAYFDEVSDHRAAVVGRVHGDYERATADEIADLVRPALDAHQAELQERACVDVREAVGSRAVAGIGDTWAAAHAGRGRQLVVEESLRYPARGEGDALTAAPADDPVAFDAVEDAVEEVIRHGGDVVVVPDGSLADAGGIALLTRY